MKIAEFSRTCQLLFYITKVSVERETVHQNREIEKAYLTSYRTLGVKCAVASGNSDTDVISVSKPVHLFSMLEPMLILIISQGPLNHVD